MADYTITQGEQKWKDKYNKFVTEQNVEISAWSDAGLVFQNGFTANADKAKCLKYRTFKRAGVLIKTEFAGAYDHGALQSKGSVEYCKIPNGITKDGFMRTTDEVNSILTNQRISTSLNSARTALVMVLFTVTTDTIAAGSSMISVQFEW